VWAEALFFIGGLIVLLFVMGEMLLRWRRPLSLASPPDALPFLTASLNDPDVQNRIRLVALGDSIVHGHNVPAEAAWPARLEARLRERYPDIPWRVINCGICGETAVQGVMRLYRDGLRFRPHVLFIAFGLNDCFLGRTAADAWREREAFPAASYGPLGRSRLYRALHRRLLREVSIQANAPWQPRVGPELFVAALRRMVRMARRAGVPYIYLLTMTPVNERASLHWLPELQTQQLALYHEYNQRIRETAAALDVGLIDVVGGFAGSDPGLLLSGDGVHLTAAGHERLADIVFAALEQDGTSASLRQP